MNDQTELELLARLLNDPSEIDVIRAEHPEFYDKFMKVSSQFSSLKSTVNNMLDEVVNYQPSEGLKAPNKRSLLDDMWEEARNYTPIEDMDELSSSLADFNSASSAADRRRILLANPRLLTKDADILAQRIISGLGSEKAIARLEETRRLLTRCKLEGIDAVFPS